MLDLQDVYLRLPTPLQHVGCSLEGWRVGRGRYGGEFDALLREAEARSLWSQEEMEAYRDQRLRIFVQHCARSVPFYRRRFRELGVAPEEIRTLSDLGRLPITKKAEVQDHYEELVSETVPRRAHVHLHTSGTTGAGLRFVSTAVALQEQWVTWWRYLRAHGVQRGTWCGYFMGRTVVPSAQTTPPFWRYNLPGRQIFFSTYHMTPANLESYATELRRRRLPWLHGYPSAIAVLATYLLDSGFDLGYEPRWVTLGAENLLPHQADVIEKAFGVVPRRHYSMVEAAANVSECELGSLHVDEDFAAVEFVDRSDGSGQTIIGTNLTNFATAFLRYDVQDLGTPSTASCPCGRPGRIVASLDGRAEDYVVTRDGGRVGPMNHIFKDMVNVREAQIHQSDLSRITLRVVRRPEYGKADEDLLIHELRRRVGSETAVEIDYVDALPRSSNGKLRAVVSEVPAPAGQPASTRPSAARQDSSA